MNDLDSPMIDIHMLIWPCFLFMEQLKVEDPPEDEDSDEDNISEPDEDTIAGQMAMLRGDKVKSTSGGRGQGDDDDDDDESGSEDQYESSSDEERPKRKRAINEDSETDSD